MLLRTMKKQLVVSITT